MKQDCHPSNKKVEAMKEARIATCVTKLRAFLCVLNYHGSFLLSLSTNLAPLYALLHKKSKLKWAKGLVFYNS